MALGDARRSQSALWSLLVFSGYLKAEEVHDDSPQGTAYRLSI